MTLAQTQPNKLEKITAKLNTNLKFYFKFLLYFIFKIYFKFL